MPKSQLIKQNDGAHILLNGSQPFYIKGAGLEFAELETFAAAGGNAFRTWRVDNGSRDVIELLDEAQRLGLSVCMGLDLARERHGFDYSDLKAVKAQNEAMMHDVERLKNHPALFMWGLGNELNLRAKNPKVWNAVDQLARQIKAADPNHLVTTMLAGIDKPTIEAIKKRAPSLDLLSFQIYGDIDQLPQILDKAGYTGPYQVTEWGPTGHWESPETSWKRQIEPSSHDKARDISRRYNDIILRDKANCLGSYIFLWGQKQERTPTWYGLFLETGERTEAIDVLQHAWTDSWPQHRAPAIDALTLNALEASESVMMSPNETAVAHVNFSTRESNTSISWVVRKEVERALQSDGGDHEPTPATVASSVATQDAHYRFSISSPGEYRLYCQIDTPNNTSAVANIPFLVTSAEEIKPKSKSIIQNTVS
ncbi:MAG: glycoside hydrolase family 2 TIM barrel-domain containing protein [Luminiphilus sp.]|nr:glycoside hydrolase family 2 TIM barrel-domain containing protein [Luminiphilus sp.]